MHSIEELHNIVNNYFKRYEWLQKPANLYKPIEYTMGLGGKRIRPILTLMSCEMFSDNFSSAIEAAAGVEIFHNFTLLHDDIMDNASIRRGVPSVFAKWDTNIALLSGDAMSIIAYKHISKVPFRMNECLDIFNDTALKICEGQQIDMDFENRYNVTVDEYLEMIQLKTAVLIACSLKIGSIIGGASIVDSDKMYNLGLQLGMAFQLQDDLLDVYGDPKVFGKAIGGDIIANKKTYLLINALNCNDKSMHDQLLLLINEKNCNDEEKINHVTKIYNKLNIKDLSKYKIASYFSNALEILESLSIAETQKAVLRELINNLESRSY